eukprot:Tamp_10626.p1 GENE.Tamp_10626~~Tamp_10626.p1  ORF type:complete len:457 (+),score=15.26 Tamp_10626:470-1840(+)
MSVKRAKLCGASIPWATSMSTEKRSPSATMGAHRMDMALEATGQAGTRIPLLLAVPLGITDARTANRTHIGGTSAPKWASKQSKRGSVCFTPITFLLGKVWRGNGVLRSSTCVGQSAHSSVGRSENGCKSRNCGKRLAPNPPPRGSLLILSAFSQHCLLICLRAHTWTDMSTCAHCILGHPSPFLLSLCLSLSLAHTHTHTQHCRHCERSSHFTHDCHRVGTVSVQVDKVSHMVLGICPACRIWRAQQRQKRGEGGEEEAYAWNVDQDVAGAEDKGLFHPSSTNIPRFQKFPSSAHPAFHRCPNCRGKHFLSDCPHKVRDEYQLPLRPVLPSAAGGAVREDDRGGASAGSHGGGDSGRREREGSQSQARIPRGKSDALSKPPAYYACMACGRSGHWRQACPSAKANTSDRCVERNGVAGWTQHEQQPVGDKYKKRNGVEEGFWERLHAGRTREFLR